MEVDLLTLLNNAIAAHSPDDFISIQKPEHINCTPSPLTISCVMFDLIPATQLTLDDIKSTYSSIKYGRKIGGLDLLPDSPDIGKLSIYPVNSRISIKLNKNGIYRVSGCKSMLDVEMIKAKFAPCEVKYNSITATGNLNCSINLTQLSIILSTKIKSPIFEPTKSRLIIKNINNLCGSISIFTRGCINITGKSIEQVEELYKFIITHRGPALPEPPACK